CCCRLFVSGAGTVIIASVSVSINTAAAHATGTITVTVPIAVPPLPPCIPYSSNSSSSSTSISTSTSTNPPSISSSGRTSTTCNHPFQPASFFLSPPNTTFTTQTALKIPATLAAHSALARTPGSGAAVAAAPPLRWMETPAPTALLPAAVSAAAVAVAAAAAPPRLAHHPSPLLCFLAPCGDLCGPPSAAPARPPCLLPPLVVSALCSSHRLR
ncbi:unnamed protein product, partial [Closterium sp. NIES-53]